MAFNRDKEFKYEIVDGFDRIIEEKGNEILALRKIRWGERDKVNLDIRRWFPNPEGGRDGVGRGTSFITENGPGELINILIQEGYGSTPEIIKNLSAREDFVPSIADALGETITDEQLERFKNNVIKYNASNLDKVYDPRDMDLD